MICTRKSKKENSNVRTEYGQTRCVQLSVAFMLYKQTGKLKATTAEEPWWQTHRHDISVALRGAGCGSPVVRVSDHGRYVMSSSPVPLKTRRVGQRCTLDLSTAETSSRWCGAVVRRGWCQLRRRPRHLTMVQNYVVRRQKPSCN
ncbi:uncharacterized protein TNCV_54701 [Trichonephila clavipes]|nr:uncharacterized protein TNCV_54701 [Trichonephila clavipes]